MATHITFRNATQVGGSSILSRAPRAAQSITASGVSQATTITAQQNEIAHIESQEAVHVAVSGTAVSGQGDLVQAGTAIDIGPLYEGDTVSIIQQ